MLDEDLYAELVRRSAVEGRSMAAVVRDALRKTIPPLPPLEEDPIGGMVGADPDAEPIEDLDEYLASLMEEKMRDAT